MFALERQQKIIELVNRKDSVKVSELSRLFSVTEETIRRDLEKLEKQQQLRRSHGGAISIEREEQELDFSDREIMHIFEKKAIAKEAVHLIDEGDTFILDASTTAWNMAKALPNIPLVVITNAIKVAIELSKKEKIEVISTGGKLLSRSLSYTGPLAERSLEQYHVSKVFLSCKGIDLEDGLSDANESQALLKRKMIERSDKVILMADSSKFGRREFSKITDITCVDQIICDQAIPNNFRQALTDRGLSLTSVGII
ncbi:DeoR/GlpR family DNA-binding transcription regulator [Bacillus sp. NPDC077027]|uniref:DeoR/GlpR family DNA-binding transcription regulator n=1 Tax=Bacillus sp. NPDC077027 TaxID=3390548 RepID=UPI003D046E2B